MSWLDPLKEEKAQKKREEELARKKQQQEMRWLQQYARQYESLIKRRLREFGRVYYAEYKPQWGLLDDGIWIGRDESALDIVWGCTPKKWMESPKAYFETRGASARHCHFCVTLKMIGDQPHVEVTREVRDYLGGLKYYRVSVPANQFTDEWLKTALKDSLTYK